MVGGGTVAASALQAPSNPSPLLLVSRKTRDLGQSYAQGQLVSRISASSPSYGFDPDEPLLKTCIIGKTRIEIEALLDSGANGGNYVNHETAQLICEKEGISPVKLTRAKCVNSYTGDLPSRCPSMSYTRDSRSTAMLISPLFILRPFTAQLSSAKPG